MNICSLELCEGRRVWCVEVWREERVWCVAVWGEGSVMCCCVSGGKCDVLHVCEGRGEWCVVVWREGRVWYVVWRKGKMWCVAVWGEGSMMCCSLLPRPFRICYVGEKALASTVLLTSRFGTISHKMSVRLCTCCICSVEVPPKHSTALFILKRLKGNLPGRLSRLLLLPFTEGDGLPPFIYQNCWAKAESIESKLRELAKDSFSKFH